MVLLTTFVVGQGWGSVKQVPDSAKQALIFMLWRKKYCPGSVLPECPLGNVIAHKGAVGEQSCQVHQDLTRPAATSTKIHSGTVCALKVY